MAEENELTPEEEAAEARASEIETVVRAMLEEGRDLTAKGVPELPVAKEKLGYSISAEELRAAYAAVVAIIGAPEPEPEPEAPQMPEGVVLPTFLYHATKEAGLARTEGHFHALIADGYKTELLDAAGGNAKEAEAIWGRETNDGTQPQ